MNPETEKVVIDLRERCGIEVEHLVVRGLLPVSQAKKWLVKELYFDYARKGNTLEKRGRTYANIKNELSVDYGVSVSTIEKLVYKK
jgi:hypothetical protein